MKENDLKNSASLQIYTAYISFPVHATENLGVTKTLLEEASLDTHHWHILHKCWDELFLCNTRTRGKRQVE